GYETEAEKDGMGGCGYNAVTRVFEGKLPEYSWRNPGFTQTDEHPVVNVSWHDASAFCDWLSKKEGKTYRLPTEAEWEYSCRAHTATRFYAGDSEKTLQRIANIADQSLKGKLNPDFWKEFVGEWNNAWSDGYPFTAPVGKFESNAFGLHDMHGNVWE